ncbi:alpha/beta fold hydrolase [Nucisporomicrobium flavum]|uniref:alpha/beta fold hydrolase n=1 Tax=Nucisporomicrobium flavum TaxID=2785915 RepID=UPI0018F77932|nr:hypothetical protein [Nucisporomicrobium flavum]
MTVVLHVHGTGVREPDYSTGFDSFRVKLQAIRPELRVEPCYWGGEHGARLRAEGVSIPAGQGAREPEEPTDRDVALWSLLAADPLFELSTLAAAEAAAARGGAGEFDPMAVRGAAKLIEQAPGLAAELEAGIAELGLADVFPGAVRAVLASAEISSLAHSEVRPADLRRPFARAVVAQSLLLAAEAGRPPIDGTHRDALVAEIVAALGGTDRGFGADAGKLGLRLALRMGAGKPVERRRAAITRSTSAVAGDVLLYLARGGAIRDHLRSRIEELGDDVVVVAHSLGGVAAVDLLATTPLPAVTGLVTVGSQAPLLYELGALPGLDFGTPLPVGFPRWLNIFDRRDLLGFTSGGLFPGRVTDAEVDNRWPFPYAHTTYFGNDALYEELDSFLR